MGVGISMLVIFDCVYVYLACVNQAAQPRPWLSSRVCVHLFEQCSLNVLSHACMMNTSTFIYVRVCIYI